MAVATKETTSSPLNLTLAWAVVVLPAAWGVYNTALRAVHLFH